jgi:hypothetical protein
MCCLFLTACQQELPDNLKGEAFLELDLLRAGKPLVATRAEVSDLTVTILREDRTVYKSFTADALPDKIVLEPGNFIVPA